MNYVFVLALGIGIVAGLRSLTAPAVVAWGAHLGWLNLHGSPLAFMGSTTAVAIFSLLAIGELIADKLPMIPKRTAPAPLIARVVTGGLCGACLCAAVGKSLLAGALLGGIGGIVGAFLGYGIRRRLDLHIKDLVVAVCEDAGCGRSGVISCFAVTPKFCCALRSGLIRCRRPVFNRRDAKASGDNQLNGDATNPAAAALSASARVRVAARCVGRARAQHDSRRRHLCFRLVRCGQPFSITGSMG